MHRTKHEACRLQTSADVASEHATLAGGADSVFRAAETLRHRKRAAYLATCTMPGKGTPHFAGGERPLRALFSTAIHVTATARLLRWGGAWLT
jgi:hypothetical protein